MGTETSRVKKVVYRKCREIIALHLLRNRENGNGNPEGKEKSIKNVVTDYHFLLARETEKMGKNCG